MDFGLTHDQEEIKELARRFAQERVAPLVREYDRLERIPKELVQEAGRLGLTGGVIPPEYGGAGLDYLSLALIVEEVSKVCHILATQISFASDLKPKFCNELDLAYC